MLLYSMAGITEREDSNSNGIPRDAKTESEYDLTTTRKLQ